MKRTPLSRGTRMLKRTPFKAKTALRPKKSMAVAKRSSKPHKKTSLKKLKNHLWELCKQITRQRYKNPDGKWYCYTCGRLIDEPAKAQTGHGIPSAVGGVILRYHLDNLRVQDYYCNINLGGNGGEFYKRLVHEIGQEKVNELYSLKGKTVKADESWYQEKILHYTKLVV